jgi:hypothetical protein
MNVFFFTENRNASTFQLRFNIHRKEYVEQNNDVK